MRNTKFFINNSWWVYLLISILLGFILLIPLFITISLDSNISAFAGNNSQYFLGSTIPLLIILDSILIIYSIKQYKSLSFSLNFNTWINKFFANLILLLIQSFLQFILFMIIWLVPIDKSGTNNIYEDVANIRIMLYAILGSVTIFVFSGLSLYLNLYNKYLITYKINKEKHAH